MRILLLYNPSSGRGHGERVAQSVRALLTRAGADVELFPTAKEAPGVFAARLRKSLQGMDLLVIAGGDGTLHHALPALTGSGVPFYHLAMGTENLFAREFRMDRTPETLDQAIKAWKVVEIDAADMVLDAGPSLALHPFVLMCSIGPDAGVIRRLDAARRGPITHFSYIRPIAAELLTAAIPRLTIEADGQRLVDDEPGMTVVANCRQYAMRIDPARSASMTDGLLDIVFFPGANPLALAAWVLRSRAGRHLREPLIYAQAKNIRITAASMPSGHPAYQLDGECGRHPFPQGFDLRLAVRPGVLRVLMP